MYRLRFVKILETILARGAHCGMFLARFYNARSRKFQYFVMKKLEFVPVLQEGVRTNAFI